MVRAGTVVVVVFVVVSFILAEFLLAVCVLLRIMQSCSGRPEWGK